LLFCLLQARKTGYGRLLFLFVSVLLACCALYTRLGPLGHVSPSNRTAYIAVPLADYVLFVGAMYFGIMSAQDRYEFAATFWYLLRLCLILFVSCATWRVVLLLGLAPASERFGFVLIMTETVLIYAAIAVVSKTLIRRRRDVFRSEN